MQNRGLVLIVEDDRVTRIHLRTHLESIGFTCIEATDGAEGLDMARRDNPDIIILDVTMPILNGYQVCKALRQDPRCRAIPILMLTVHAEKEDEIFGQEVGADCYITKPFELDQLEKAIGRLIKKNQALPGDKT